MAAPVKLKRLDDFPSRFHPLHVLVNKTQFSETFATLPGASHALVISLRDGQTHQCRELLVSANAAPDEDAQTQAQAQAQLLVFASDLFFKHHDVPEDSLGTVRAQPLLPLTRIVIGCRSKQSFKWASSGGFHRTLRSLVSSGGVSVLARRGDVLLVPVCDPAGDGAADDVVVLECAPISVGAVTVDTTLVVTLCKGLDLGGARSRVPCASAGTSCLFFSDCAHYANTLSVAGSLLSCPPLACSDFVAFLQALECQLDVRVVEPCRLLEPGGIVDASEADGGVDVDVDGVVFVSRKLLLKLGVFDGEWVSASVPVARASGQGLTNPTRPSGLHLVRVRAYDLDHAEECGFLTVVQWFNLSGQRLVPSGKKGIRIKRWNKTFPDAESRVSASSCRSAAPVLAKELHVELVASPEYSSRASFDDLLHKHFSSPRLVQTGNIFGIRQELDPASIESNFDLFPRWTCVYFRVKRLFASSSGKDELFSAMADADHTSLYMSGSARCPSPRSASSLLPSSPSLSGSVEQLLTIIQPYLSQSPFLWKKCCSILLIGPNGSGKVTVLRDVCRRLHLHLMKVDCSTICADTASASEAKMKCVIERAESHPLTLLLLRNLHLIGQSRNNTDLNARVLDTFRNLLSCVNTSSTVVVGSVCSERQLSSDTAAAFTHQVTMANVSQEERSLILSRLTENMQLGTDVDLAKMGKQTVGLVLGDFCTLISNAGKAAYRRLLKTYFSGNATEKDEENLCVSGVSVLAEDFSAALQTLQEAQSLLIHAPKIPSVRWQDVGGLQQVKKDILDTIQFPLEHPELFGLRRSGLLLYGPPGTGKTLLAKAIATECSMTFLSVKGPELINKYIGQSEENIRKVFQKARLSAPCIIFFDELDSLAPKRGNNGDSAGVMDRVVSQLLAELDVVPTCGEVYVIGATNRPDLLDQTLLRPGRFDKLVYVGANNDQETHLQVLKAILHKFRVDPSVCLSEVVRSCPPQLTGADIYALCSDAMLHAIKRKLAAISQGQLTSIDGEDAAVMLCWEDFRQAVSGLQPSVSEDELQRYKRIQLSFHTK